MPDLSGARLGHVLEWRNVLREAKCKSQKAHTGSARTCDVRIEESAGEAESVVSGARGHRRTAGHVRSTWRHGVAPCVASDVGRNSLD